MQTRKLTGLLVFSTLVASAHAGGNSAEVMPCGSNQITLGMTPDEIIDTCGKAGEPAMVTEHVRPALGENVSENAEDVFEKWLYPTTDRRGNTHVVIKNGEVVKIFTTGR